MKYPRLHSESLFELIKSLSASEIRYFKLIASLQGGEKSYLKLFDTIRQQDKYDEEHIKHQYKNEKIANNIHIAKKYIYDLILKTLRTSDTENFVYNELCVLAHNVKLLFAKGLYKHCLVLIRKMKQMALEVDLFEFALSASNWELEIIITQGLTNVSLNDTKKIFQEHFEYIEKMKLSRKYLKLRTEMVHLIMETGIVRNQKQKQKYEKFMRNKLLQNEKLAPTAISKRWFHSIHSVYSTAVSKPELSYSHIKKSLATMSLLSLELKDRPGVYVGELSSLAEACIQAGKYDECISTVTQIRQLCSLYSNKITPARIAWILCSCYERELRAYILAENLRGAESAMLQALTFITKNKATIQDYMKANLLYRIAYVNFLKKEFKAALKVVNELLMINDVRGIENTIRYGKILQLILHYELKNEDIIPYLTRNLYRYLLKAQMLYAAEHSLLNFIRKQIPKIKTKHQLLLAYKKWLIELKKIQKNNYEKSFFRELDLTYWLKEKINRLDSIEIKK